MRARVKPGSLLGSVLVLIVLLSSCSTPAANAGGAASRETSRETTMSVATVVAVPPSTSTSVLPVLGTTLGGIALGMRGPEVLRILGVPKVRTVAHGRGTPQWEYADGLTIQLNDPNSPDAPDAVWEILARPPFSGATVEGFRLGDTEAQFRSIYRDFPVTKDPVPPPQLGITDRTGTTLNVLFDASGKAIMITLTRRDAMCGRCGRTHPSLGAGEAP